MNIRIPASMIPPDLRFAALPALARPGVATLQCQPGLLTAETSLPCATLLPRYILFGDQNAYFRAEGLSSPSAVRRALSSLLKADIDTHRSHLALLLTVLDAFDYAFRRTGLWKGHVYLAGDTALRLLCALSIPSIPKTATRSTSLYELHALQLAYVFPVAIRFRATDAYDGLFQFRINGWGRSLVSTSPWPVTAAIKEQALARVTQHVMEYREVYAAHLVALEQPQDSHPDDASERAQQLPLPILI